MKTLLEGFKLILSTNNELVSKSKLCKNQSLIKNNYLHSQKILKLILMN